MSDEPSYEPREHDHLVEPFFAGLEVSASKRKGGQERVEPAEETPRGADGWLVRMARWFRRILR